MEILSEVFVPILIALISAGGTAYISGRNQNIEHVKFVENVKNQLASFKSDLNEIKEHLREHNGYAKKFSDTSIELTQIRGDIQVIKNNHNNLEKQLDKIQKKLE